MGSEELGITTEEQIQIRGLAVLGAIRDMRGPDKPASRAESEESKARVELSVSKIMEENGLSDIEARLILAEQIILSLNRGE